MQNQAPADTALALGARGLIEAKQPTVTQDGGELKSLADMGLQENAWIAERDGRKAAREKARLRTS
jgi:hypothetical protein